MTTKLALILSGALLWANANLAGAAPILLSDGQMDTVTAGAINITATATAAAAGITTTTSALTKTFLLSKPNVEIGIASAKGYACCGTNTDATATTSGSATGTKVITNQVNHVLTTPNATTAFSRLIIVSIGPH